MIPNAMRTIAVLAMAFAAAASATSYQHDAWYHPTGGYEEALIAPGTYSVHVKVNGFTDRGTALTYAYRRSAELCRSGFDIVTGETSSMTSYNVNGNTVTQVDKPEVTLIVRCH